MSPKTKSSERQFVIRLAETELDVLAAQHLRYQVFVQELGASGPTVDHARQLEVDEFDQFYDHLLLVDPAKNPKNQNHVVGVYRLLKGDTAKQNKGFYSECEYNLDKLKKSNKRLLELGRSCVAKKYRGGTSMFRLWNALAEYVISNEIDVLFGVASYHGTDINPIAQSLSYLHHFHLSPIETRVHVRPEFDQPIDIIAKSDVDKKLALAQTPPLIKAYLRLGGTIGEGAYIDRDFNTLDICLIMDTAIMSQKHKQVYTRRAGAK